MQTANWLPINSFLRPWRRSNLLLSWSFYFIERSLVLYKKVILLSPFHCLLLIVYWKEDALITALTNLFVKTRRFQAAVPCSVPDHMQQTPKCDEYISDTIAYQLMCHLVVVPHFHVICNLSSLWYWKDAQQHGIYLLINLNVSCFVFIYMSLYW